MSRVKRMVVAGDEVILTDSNGTTYAYAVTETFEVAPTDLSVTAPTGGDTLSLQTCIEDFGDYWTMGPRLARPRVGAPGPAPPKGVLVNEQVSTVRAPRAGGTYGAARLLVIALLAAAFVALAAPDQAQAEEVGFVGPDSDVGFADTDGYVPIYSGCLPYNVGAFYAPYYDGYTVQGSIVVNACYLERVGAGPMDLRRLLRHEMGHARGLLHSPDPSDIMYSVVPLTGD